jgi:hypothetical protein
LLVLGTSNPGGYSYFSWVLSENTSFVRLVAIVGLLLLILTVGMAWSHVKRRLTGLVNVDDVDD